MIVAAALWFLVGIEVLLVADYSFTLSGRLVIDYYHYYSIGFSKKNIELCLFSFGICLILSK